MISITLTEGGSSKPFETFIEGEMDKSVKHLEKELSKLRTGRASTAMIEDIKISCYGSLMLLKDTAALSAPEPTLLVVQPWDKSIMQDIEKAISLSDLGVTPLNDGTVIRIQLPRISKERRDELVKVLQKKLEECKISIRNTRKDVHSFIRDTEKAKKISEDYGKRLQDLLQKITDKFCDLADKVASKKEIELKEL